MKPSNAPIRLAATVLLLRDGPQGMEVFMVVRHPKIDFASGALVFPGGKLAAGDSEPRVRARCSGVDALDADHVALRVGAIREAFEECGVLLAREVGSSELVSAERLQTLGPKYREGLEAGEIGIGEMLEAEDLTLACEGLTHFAHWLTPAFMPKRFDTHFYLAEAASKQVAGHDGRETVDSLWIRPADALAQADAGKLTLVPATRLNVEKLGESASVAQAFENARAHPAMKVEPQVDERDDGVWLTIPPEAGYRINEFKLPSDA